MQVIVEYRRQGTWFHFFCLFYPKGTHHDEVEVSVVSETVFGKDDSSQHRGRDPVGSPGDLECVRVNIEDVLTEKCDETYGEDEPDADDNVGITINSSRIDSI